MNLLPSEEQLDIVSAALDFVDSRLPVAGIRERAELPSAVDPALWREGAELGLLTLGLDESFGGSGRPLDDEVLVFSALATRLAPGPFLASTLAARVAAQCGEEQLAARIGGGAALVGLGELRGDGAFGPDGFTGSYDLLDCVGATHVLLLAKHGAALVEFDQFSDVTAVSAIDPAVRLSTSTVTSGRVAHWLPATTDPLFSRAQLLAAATLAGLAAAAKGMATEHANTRVQFGKPIGVNQAVKHMCADMAVSADASISQTLFAAIAFQSGRADSEFQILSAKSVAARAAIDNASHNIQVHGGMGYTYEHNAHLVLKRAHVFAHLFDEPTDVLAQLLQQGAAQ
ncbi:acyl-CoA dehydrogenase family protein [Dietzia psychralcaliphila]|uniref:acyl-CoA dehydrogenase family protein n=1 Tax=Dietzia psychralcaliphila TaxID=139021 RepID=UPI001C1E452C|nr:acyl-CoA dehydrogenase family protein [Dietzia psychralcaliphila]